LTFGNAAPSRRRMRAHPRFRVFPQPGAVSGQGWMPTRQGGGSVVGGHRSPDVSVNVSVSQLGLMVAPPNACHRDDFPPSIGSRPDEQDGRPTVRGSGYQHLERSDGLLPGMVHINLISFAAAVIPCVPGNRSTISSSLGL